MEKNPNDQHLRHLNKISHKISKQPAYQQQQQQHQQPPPPVYKINKSDFREVVQKLTGSHAHISTPPSLPPIQSPKPPSSRLQRIRPPPLAQLTNKPATVTSQPPFFSSESPVSAYMKYLQSSTPTPTQNPLNFESPSNLYQLQSLPHSPTFAMPNSPLGFGKISSPGSPYHLFSPSSLFSPTMGQWGFPQSPRLAVSSPRWRAG